MGWPLASMDWNTRGAELIERAHLAGGSWCAGHGNTSS